MTKAPASAVGASLVAGAVVGIEVGVAGVGIGVGIVGTSVGVSAGDGWPGAGWVAAPPQAANNRAIKMIGKA